MGFSDFLKNLIPSPYNTHGEVFSVLLGAVGQALDQYNPTAIGLKAEFSITTASGSALDSNGADWEELRRPGESDAVYKQRILSILPLYLNGPSVPGIAATIKPFTGSNPTIFEYGPNAFTIGESAIGEAGFSTGTDAFTFEIHIVNPNNVSYDHLDMENAIRTAKLARSSAIVYHSGPDLSPLAEATNAVVTIT